MRCWELASVKRLAHDCNPLINIYQRQYYENLFLSFESSFTRRFSRANLEAYPALQVKTAVIKLK